MPFSSPSLPFFRPAPFLLLRGFAIVPLLAFAHAVPLQAAPAPASAPAPDAAPRFRDVDAPIDQRIDDLVGRLTVDEKIGQLMMQSPGIPRLGIPAYHWWSEGLHGVARDGIATVFPQAIALAATWDPALHYRIAEAISTEARAKNNELVRRTGGASGQFEGLTIWSPNINIFRDPRWGRGQETYGEDPFLTGRMAVAFVRGLQGNDPRYLKTVATLKHFAVHSGPESLRHRFDAVVSERDLHETYLSAFEAGVREGGVWSLMSAYNAIDGVPAPANARLLTEVLRREWGFRGAVVGDVDTVADLWDEGGHHFSRDAAEASAAALKAGTDLCSGTTYEALPESLRRGLVTGADIDRALRRVLLLRFKLGQFDPRERVPYTRIPASENDSRAHELLALQAARESLVLLKNDGSLPWAAERIRTLAVLGPTADLLSPLVGNYNGTPARPVTLLAGLRRQLEPQGVRILFEPAVPLVTGFAGGPPVPADGLARALAAARAADHIVLTLGITPDLEGEEMNVKLEGFSGGDRTSILLPKTQRDLIDQVAALGRPFVVVLTGGSALSFDVAKPGAVLMAWYYGERGGDAVAEALLGKCNPSGRLPVTFYRSDADLPPFTDYSMAGRTYRYFAGTPLFAFGHGLSYTRFSYDHLTFRESIVAPSGTLRVRVRLRNTGARAGDEVVQAYARSLNRPEPGLRQQLVGFQRVTMGRGQASTVDIAIPVETLRRWDEGRKDWVVDSGAYELWVGPASDQLLLNARFEVRKTATLH